MVTARWFRRSVISALVASMVVGLVLCVGPAVSAASLGASQVSERPATLVGPRKDAPIPLYLRPAANQPPVGYGASGSTVTVLEQVASFLPEADQNSAWNHIRLEDAPYTEGWVQGRFLSLSDISTEVATEDE